MKNLCKAYYKDYYKDICFKLVDDPRNVVSDDKIINEKNTALVREIATGEYVKAALSTFSTYEPLRLQEFSLEVSYPGLITGIGIDHEAGVESEFKLGIHMDYTSGLPVIYGSSVKGVLREAFRYENLFETLDLVLPENKNEIDALKDKFAQKNIAEWEKIIFGDDKSNDKDPRSVYQRDIFFDAIVCKANADERILAADALAPHNESPLKNPVPITFVKIAPGCRLQYRFHLKDSDEVSADDKALLFKYILMAFGVGAKTNVGYGQLTDTNCCQNQP